LLDSLLQESDIELVETYTAAVADPRMPIPLPDQTNDPPGTHIPPMTPPPIKRIPTPIQDSEEKLLTNTQITVQKISSSDLDIPADLGLGPDIEYDEDGAPIIKKTDEPNKVEESKVNILDQIENEIQQKIQEAAKASTKPKVEPSKTTESESSNPKSPVKLVTKASVRDESKLESPNPEGDEREAKRIKLDETPPQESNQPGAPVKAHDSGQPSLSSTNGYNPVEPARNGSVTSPPFVTPPTSQPLGPVSQPTHLTTPHIPYSTQSAPPPQLSQTPYHVPISHHDPGRMHPNQPYPYEPMPNREHYYPMPPPIPNQPPMMQPMQQNFYPPPPQPPFTTQQHQQLPAPPPPAFPNQKQSRFFPYTGYSTPIHTFNDTVEPGPDGRLPLDYWTSMSCTVDIPNCPLNCCHVRAHQEIMEGSTNWKAPYGPPLNGLQPCSCCINS